MKPFLKQVFVVAGAAVNILGHGCAHGYPAVLFQQLKANGGHPVKLTDDDTSWIASVVGIMGVVGNFISPILMTRFGRQKAHLMTTIPALLGWLIFIHADSVPLFILARLFHGLALGLRTPLAAILVAEYTDPKYRGAFLGTFAISLGAGIMLSHIWGGILSWTMTAMVCSLFPILAMVIISLSPESPGWLISKGRFEEAKKSFRWLRGEGMEQDAELESMIQSRKDAIALMEINKNEKRQMPRNKSARGTVKKVLEGVKSFLRILRKKEFYKPSLIAICMLVVFEFGGAHMVASYGHDILKSVYNTTSNSKVSLQLIVVDSLRTVCAFLAIFLLKRFNRRTILFTSGVMTVLSLSLISVFIYTRQYLGIEGWVIDDFIPTCLMVTYTLSFCLGIVPLTWVICGEVFPLAYRGLGSTISTSFLTPSYIVSMKTAPYLFSSVGVEGAFLIYSVCLTSCFSVIYCLLPETKDRTLQEIEDSFTGRKRRDVEAEINLMEKTDIVIK